MNHCHAASKRPSLRPLFIAMLVGGCATSALATNGYFSHGYGIKAKGMGGASVAMTDDAFGGANNPASSAWAGNRMEVGVDIFMPKRGVDRAGLGAVDSDSNTFYVPEFGYNRKIDDKWGVGLTVYGNGGLNTDYAGGQIPAGFAGCGAQPVATNLFCGVGRLGIDMMQLIVAPTVAYKFDANQSVGVSPLFVQQIFKADGLQGFDNGVNSSAPGSVTGNGYDSSNGFGLRLGYLGKFGNVALGASYAPKISMSKFSKYSGLFADGGNFDIPTNYTFGVAIKATPDVTVAVDYQRILYSGVVSVNNPSTNAAQLGSANGPGFGWNDINTWKIGAEWKLNNSLTLRGGINIGGNPIDSRDASFNVLAPGVVTRHYTLGATYALSKSSEISASYMTAPSNSVTGPNTGGSTDTISMSQQSLGLQFGWKF